MPLFGLVSCFILHFVLWLICFDSSKATSFPGSRDRGNEVASKVLKVGGKQKPYQMWQAGISLAGFPHDGIWRPARSLARASRQLCRLPKMHSNKLITWFKFKLPSYYSWCRLVFDEVQHASKLAISVENYRPQRFFV